MCPIDNPIPGNTFGIDSRPIIIIDGKSLFHANQFRSQCIGTLYPDGASLMPLRSINSIVTVNSRMGGLIILSFVVILLYLLAHHEVGTRNLADTELIRIGNLKFAELLEFFLVSIVVFIDYFLLDARQTAIGGV